jgi:hypothetical protein
MSNNSSVPGITYPTVQSTGAGSPRDAAIANNAAMNAKQAEANKMTAGSKKKGGAVTVGVPQVSYTPTGGPGQDPTSITKLNAQYGSQSSANAEFDKNALKGGSRRKRKGGNPDWIWGCYSGGKKRKTRTNKRKTRKYRKKTRRNKK